MAFTPKTKQYTSEAGVEYTFQSVMNSVQASIHDEGTDATGKILNAKMMPLMLEKIIVQPQGLTMDDFESWAELSEVTMEAYSFLRSGK